MGVVDLFVIDTAHSAEEREMGIGGRVVLVALLAASLLSPGGGILHERSIEENARRFVKRQDAGGRHIQPSLELRKRLNEARPFSYRPAEELGSRTARSDDQDSSCDLKMTALLETNPVSPYSLATIP